MPWRTIIRRSVACNALAGFVLIACLHLALRPRPWIHEWYWTVDAYHFVTILLAPLVAGVAAWDGARWSGAHDAMTSSHGLPRAFLSSCLPSALVGFVAYIVGLVIALLMTKIQGGTPAWPDLAVAFTVAPALSLIALSSAVGAAAGWLAKRAMIGPVVAVAVFVVLFAGYTILPESLLRVGGATASLLALAPRPSIQALQSALYIACAVAAACLFVRRADRLPRGRTLVASTAALAVAGLAGLLTDLGGMRFVEVNVDVECAGAEPIICLSPSYEHLRHDIEETVAEPFRRFADAGFDPPSRLTQDFTAPTSPGTVPIPTGRVDVYDVETMLIFSLFPADCDVFRNAATYRDYVDLAYWIESLLGIALPDDPTVSPAVADGDTPEARDHVRRIQQRYAECER